MRAQETLVTVTRKETESVLAKLVGMPVSDAYLGRGSTVYFELGDLHPFELRSGRIIQSGQITLLIQWDWRVEKASSIWFGSGSSLEKAEARIPKLVGCTIEEAWLEGRLPELRLKLSGGYWFSTHMCFHTMQEWYIMSGPRPNRSASYFCNGMTFKKRIYGEISESPSPAFPVPEEPSSPVQK